MSKKGLAVAEPLAQEEKLDNKIAKVKAAKRPNETLVQAAERLGIVDQDELGAYLSEHYQLPFIDIQGFEVDESALKTISAELCQKYCVLPISKAGNTLVVAFSDPSNLYVRDDLAYVTRCKIEPVVATEKAIRAAHKKHFQVVQEQAGDILSEIEEVQDVGATANELEESDAPVIKFVNVMLSEAVREGVSDIHIETYEKAVRVRFRKDGQLIEKYKPPVTIGAALSTRIKVLAKLDVAERRRPQDGRIKLKFKDKGEVDFRVNILPVVDGEKTVLRILDQTSISGIELSDLGFTEPQLEILLEAISKPQGMVLVTGPTGSGKTTTLYASLQKIHDPTINISTAEDPVEFKLEGINQTQINPDIEYGFAEALRAFLRQDPDVILVGEIRDMETAEIAFKASSTGHLVLSTLHTNDAPGTVSRLLEMGVPGYMITSCVELILAQRLLGKICNNCKQPEQLTPQMLKQLGIKAKSVEGAKFFKGMGCDECFSTGIRGRVGIYEFMPLTDQLKDSILKGATPLELKISALKSGMVSLRQSALEKAKLGLVSLGEVIQGTMKDPEL